MEIYLIYVSIFIILFVLELLYFKIACNYHIMDIPNERSSHANVVLRGGGIIFLFGIWIWALFGSFPLHTEIDFPHIGDVIWFCLWIWIGTSSYVKEWYNRYQKSVRYRSTMVAILWTMITR